jgi:hypothetical protein
MVVFRKNQRMQVVSRPYHHALGFTGRRQWHFTRDRRAVHRKGFPGFFGFDDYCTHDSIAII